MKNTFRFLALFAAVALMFGCSQVYPEISIDELPLASELDVTIDVDQSTNIVTFTLNNKGLTPMWIFSSEDKPDAAADRNKYAVTVNGYSARFRSAGIHSVEIKAYNANGICDGSIIKEFTLDNTYRDPFDATPYMNAISNSSSQEWVWNSTVADHFGCGESGGNGLGLWNAEPDAKKECSLYDDVLTFTSGGDYTYDPTDGKVYVNKDCSFDPASNNLKDKNGNPIDYTAPIEKYTVKYTIEQRWNEAGVEEIWLVLPTGKNLSYIPNDDALTKPEFRFLETSTSKMKKELVLVNDNGAIAWHYNFVPKAKVRTQEDILSGDGTKVWIMDAATEGHLACGPSVEDPYSWWKAAAYAKADFGLYDDELTFNLDGTYKFNPGADGKIYVNSGTTVLGTAPASEDFDVEYAEKTATWSIVGDQLVLPAENVIGYLPHDDAYAEPKYTITVLNDSALELIWYTPTGNNGGSIAWHYRFIPRDGDGEKVTFNGEEFVSGQVEVSLSKGDPITVTGIKLTDLWIDPDFFTVSGSNVTFAAADGDYRVVYDSSNKWFKVLPLHNGSLGTWETSEDIWIIGTGGGKPSSANAIGWVTEAALPMAKIADKTYQITLAPVQNESVKLFGQANWGTEWTHNEYTAFEDGGFCSMGTGSSDGDPGNIFFRTITAGKFYRLTAVVEADRKATLTVTEVDVDGVEEPWVLGEPIDASQYSKEIVGTWTWEPSTKGHFGCGESIANPVGWWSADPYAKKDFSLYDDRITFTSGGKYTFDPVDGKTYVNTGVTTYEPTYKKAEDFVAPATVQTVDYTVDAEGESYCVNLPAKTLLSYLAHDEQLTNCKYYIVGMWDNALDLVWYTPTGNNGGAIAWKYHFKRVD